MGTTPARLVSPTVGFSATTPFAFPGQTMLPSVSEPSEMAEKFAEAAAPEPELDPHGLRLIPYGLFVCPPRPDQPLIDPNERKFAHSERLVLPRMTAPPARRLAAMVESCSAGLPTSANEPALVCIRSPVSMLSLSSTGMPCNGPSTLPSARTEKAASASRAAIILRVMGYPSGREGVDATPTGQPVNRPKVCALQQCSPQDSCGGREVDDQPRHVDQRGDERRAGAGGIESEPTEQEGQQGSGEGAEGHDADQRERHRHGDQ